MAVMQMNLFSMQLKRGTDCTVILPEALADQETLKVLWLYHGGSGDHQDWLYHAPLTELVESRHFAIVLPNAENSCFVNMKIGEKFASYIGKELPETLWRMMPCLSSRREDNYVAGFSNGGYGCLHLALRYPKHFSKAGAFSAGDKADAECRPDDSRRARAMEQLFGTGDLHETEYSIVHQAAGLLKKEAESGKNVEKPMIYHACGGKDPWLSMNHIVRDYFETHQKEFAYQYEEMPEYGHEWAFWRKALIHFLDYAGLLEGSVQPGR